MRNITALAYITKTMSKTMYPACVARYKGNNVCIGCNNRRHEYSLRVNIEGGSLSMSVCYKIEARRLSLSGQPIWPPIRSKDSTCVVTEAI